MWERRLGFEGCTGKKGDESWLMNWLTVVEEDIAAANVHRIESVGSIIRVKNRAIRQGASVTVPVDTILRNCQPYTSRR